MIQILTLGLGLLAYFDARDHREWERKRYDMPENRN